MRALPKALLYLTLAYTVCAVGRLSNANLAQAQAGSPAPAATNPAPAAPEITITAIPPRLGDDGSLKAKPGEKIQTSVRVRNASNQTVNLDSFVEDFVIGDDGVTPIPVDGEVSNRWSLASWVLLTPNRLTLKPNEVGMVNVLIQVPEDALPGGHYAMILHRPGNGQKGEFVLGGTPASASQVNQRVGTLLYVMVDGPINEEAYIRDFEFPQLTEYGPVPFKLSLENRSDIHIKPQVSVEITNLFGKKVDTIQLEPKNVFPYMTRNFDGHWNRVWGIGWYRARAVISYGTGGQLVVANTAFWLIPYKIVIAGVVVFLVGVAAFIAIRRHFLHRDQQEQARIKALEQKLADLESEKK